MSVSVSSSQGSESAGYDWRLEENCTKWRGIFVPALQKVLTQVHPTLVAKEDALEYVEGLILRLLEMLTAKPTPVSVQDVEDRITRTFPTPIDKWALSEAQSAVEKGRKKSCLVLPVEKVHPILSKEVLQNRVDDQVSRGECGSAGENLGVAGDLVHRGRAGVHLCRHLQTLRQLRQAHPAPPDLLPGREGGDVCGQGECWSLCEDLIQYYSCCLLPTGTSGQSCVVMSV